MKHTTKGKQRQQLALVGVSVLETLSGHKYCTEYSNTPPEVKYLLSFA
jgi:hypothetical protein